MPINKKNLFVMQKLDLAISVEKTWEILKDFNGMASWHPAVANSRIIKGNNNQEGAVRLLSLHDGGSITEELLDYCEQSHSIAYNISDCQLPISEYISVLTVHAAGQGSLVIWQGSFKRKHEEPVSGADDETAKKIVTGIYTAGFDGLKQKCNNQ
ncbi:SRPBCC family protein [Collimonas sp.]|jgi:mxaD protein|uniref:SRPBCC family protein n=1 Tax=Collimonas sp. TaxID=1963772 RepID=UPI002CF74069|nr:SRPBCC family protein [Collimonas sp.]HWW08175.1 SRPBCC family protein [Collimonas sp.]